MLTNHNAKRANAQLGWFFVGSADSSRQQVKDDKTTLCPSLGDEFLKLLDFGIRPSSS